MDEKVITKDQNLDVILGRLGEQIQPAIAAGAESAIRELGLGPVERKAGAFPLVKGESSELLPQSERTLRFFKAVFTGDMISAKALSGSTDTAGGFLVPTGFREEVVKRLPEIAELAPYTRSVPVSTDTGSLPSLATDISITWRSAASSEGTAFGNTDPVFGSVSWALKRADAITKMSRELIADSAPSIVEFITGLFREAIAIERDRVIAIGDGSTEPMGLYSTSGIEAISVGGSLSFTKLVEIEQSLKRKYRKNSRWVMNGTNLQRIFSLLDTQNRPIFTRDVIGGAPESRILGYPVSQQDDLPDDTLFLGDLSNYLWFDRGEMGIESTNEGGDAFANHQTWIKVWERVDGKVALPEAFVKGTGITA